MILSTNTNSSVNYHHDYHLGLMILLQHRFSVKFSFSEYDNKSQLIVMILPLKHIFQLHSYHHTIII